MSTLPSREATCRGVCSSCKTNHHQYKLNPLHSTPLTVKNKKLNFSLFMFASSVILYRTKFCLYFLQFSCNLDSTKISVQCCQTVVSFMKTGAVKGIFYLGVQVNLYPYFLHLFSALGEISCKRSGHKTVHQQRGFKKVMQSFMDGHTQNYIYKQGIKL